MAEFIMTDRVQETTTVAGTGDATMLGATTGCVAFATAMATGDFCAYCIDSGTGQWERGLGVWSDTTNALTRTLPLKGSSGDGTLVNFVAGTKNVFISGVNTASLTAEAATITTTGNTDKYVIAPCSGHLVGAFFSALVALAAHDTNYLTFSITNLGQAGAGAVAMLGTDNTKITGGTALAINTKRTMVLTSTLANLAVTKGDRLLIRAAASGTLANTVTIPVYLLNFVGLI